MKFKAVPIRSMADLKRIKKLFKEKTGYDLMTQQELAVYQDVLKQAAIQKQIERKEAFEHNSEVQRHRTLTTEEKARSAIDLSTKAIKTFNDAKAGRDTTEEEAREKATELAYKSEKLSE